MKNAICLILSFFSCGFVFSQLEGYDMHTWPFKVCITVPTVSYGVQRSNMTELQNASNPYLFKNRTRMANYDLLKGAFLFDNHYLIGAQIGFTSRGKIPKLKSFIEDSNPNYHILNYNEMSYNFTIPRFFAGYQYTFKKQNKDPHVIGFNFYLNFDFYDYGLYSYDAKNVSNNTFYSYLLTAQVKKSNSFTFEIEKHRLYKLKDSLKGWNIGLKLGITPRNQEITVTELKRDELNDFETVTSTTFDLKSWTFYIGLQFSFVTTPTYYTKKKK